MVIPPTRQSQNRPSDTSPSGSSLYYGGVVGGVISITVCMIFIYCCCLRKRYNRQRESTSRHVVPRFIETSRANYRNQRGAEYNADTRPQEILTIRIPMVPASELRQPVTTESDDIGETINDRSLSNEPPPSYYDVQAQKRALPSYTEVMQENRLQKSVETINAAGPSGVTVAQEQRQFQETSAGAEASHEAQDSS